MPAWIELLVGGAIGFAPARWYYQRSLWDAEEKARADRAQAAEHTLMLATLLCSAERAGHVTLTRAADGSITGGETLDIQAADTWSLSSTAYVTVSSVGRVNPKP